MNLTLQHRQGSVILLVRRLESSLLLIYGRADGIPSIQQDMVVCGRICSYTDVYNHSPTCIPSLLSFLLEIDVQSQFSLYICVFIIVTRLEFSAEGISRPSIAYMYISGSHTLDFRRSVEK